MSNVIFDNLSMMSAPNDRPRFDFDFHGEALDTIFDDYAAMRERCPVAWSDRYGGFWAVTGYDDIHWAEHDPETFSVAPSMILPSFATDRALIPLDIDPPELTAYRQMLLPFFTPKRMDTLVDRTVELAEQLLDDYGDAAVIDVARYSRMLPCLVFSEYVGFPLEHAEQFDIWVEQIVFARTEDLPVAEQAAADVYQYFRDLIARRRADRSGHDVITELIDAPLGDHTLTDEELLDICYLLFVAGLETTASTIRSALWYLGQHPDDVARLVADPALIPSAGEEFLRTLCPVQAMARTLKRDTVIGGVEMAAGDRVALVFGAANRDPARFEHPDEIRIDRADNPHSAFGLGAHRCLGSNLARREIQVALSCFLQRYPTFTLAEPAPWHGIGPLQLAVPPI
jgi:cytochrome P450